MDTSIFLAKLIGIVLIVLCISILLNIRHIQKMWQNIINNPVSLFIIGYIDFVFGLLIVLFHNIWESDWRVWITLIGWLTLIKGALRLLFPSWILRIPENMGDKYRNLYALLAILFLILGIFLTYKGFYYS